MKRQINRESSCRKQNERASATVVKSQVIFVTSILPSNKKKRRKYRGIQKSSSWAEGRMQEKRCQEERSWTRSRSYTDLTGTLPLEQGRSIGLCNCTFSLLFSPKQLQGKATTPSHSERKKNTGFPAPQPIPIKGEVGRMLVLRLIYTLCCWGDGRFVDVSEGGIWGGNKLISSLV